jgi:hypothetical protein
VSGARDRTGRRLDVAALRLVASVQPALLLLQAAIAGQFLGGNAAAVGLHWANADLIQLLGLVQVVLAIVVWTRRGPAWPAAVSALLLVAIEVQFVMGFRQQVKVHVPLGVAIFGVMLWLAIALGRVSRSEAARRKPRSVGEPSSSLRE